MILINFAHSFTDEQLQQLEKLINKRIDRIIEINAPADLRQPSIHRITTVVDRVGLTPQEWDSQPFVVNLPALSVSAALILTEIHGRSGHFPAIVRMRPVPDAVPPRFEVAEVVNLQVVRDGARMKRVF